MYIKQAAGGSGRVTCVAEYDGAYLPFRRQHSQYWDVGVYLLARFRPHASSGQPLVIELAPVDTHAALAHSIVKQCGLQIGHCSGEKRPGTVGKQCIILDVTKAHFTAAQVRPVV